jgi:hypothetical protein
LRHLKRQNFHRSTLPTASIYQIGSYF